MVECLVYGSGMRQYGAEPAVQFVVAGANFDIPSHQGDPGSNPGCANNFCYFFMRSTQVLEPAALTGNGHVNGIALSDHHTAERYMSLIFRAPQDVRIQ